MAGLTGEATDHRQRSVKDRAAGKSLKQKGFVLLLKKSDVRGLKSDVWIAHYFIDKYQNCVIN